MEIGFVQKQGGAAEQIFPFIQISADRAFLEEVEKKLVLFFRLGFPFQILNLSAISENQPFDMGSLIELRYLFHGQGGDLYLSGLNPQVAGLLNIFGINKVLKTFSREEDLFSLLPGAEEIGNFSSAFFPGEIFPLTPQHPALVIRIPSQLGAGEALILQKGMKKLCDGGQKLSLLDLKEISSPSPAILDTLNVLAEHWSRHGSALWIANVSSLLDSLIKQSEVLGLEKVSQSPENLELFQLSTKKAAPSPASQSGPSSTGPYRESLIALDVDIYPLSRQEGGKAVFMRLEGSLNTSNYHNFSDVMEKLLKNKNLFFSLDLSSLKYVNSTGLSLLIQLSYEIMEKKGKLCLVGMSPHVKGIVKMMGVDSVLNLLEREEEAKKILGVSPDAPSPVFKVPPKKKALVWEEISLGGAPTLLVQVPQDLEEGMESFEEGMDQLCEKCLLQGWDCAALGEITPSSLRSLAKWMGRIKKMGGQVALFGLEAQVKDQFDKAGIGNHVPLLGNRQEVLVWLAERATR